MKPRRLFEVCWIIGIPQSGKTTLAVSRAVARARERGVPLFAIDGAEAAQLRGFPLRSSVLEALDASFARGEDSRIVPRSIGELDALLRGIRAGRRAVVLVDEAHNWLSARDGTSGELLRLMRKTQHAEVDLFATTHHLTGDVPQAAISCTQRVLVFRQTASVVLDRLERDWNAPRRKVATLPQFHYLELVIGFDPPSSRKRNGPRRSARGGTGEETRAACRATGAEVKGGRRRLLPGAPGQEEHDGSPPAPRRRRGLPG